MSHRLICAVGRAVPARTHFDRYVDAVNGNDSHDGESLGTAWKTAAKAFESAPSGAKVGVANGKYAATTITRRSPMTLQALGPHVDFERIWEKGSANQKLIGINTVGGATELNGRHDGIRVTFNESTGDHAEDNEYAFCHIASGSWNEHADGLYLRTGCKRIVARRCTWGKASVGVNSPYESVEGRQGEGIQIIDGDIPVGVLGIDCFQLASSSDFLIDGGRYHLGFDPSGKLHNDGVQTTGDIHGLTVRNAELIGRFGGTQGQFTFLQSALGSAITGTTLIENNLIRDYGTETSAVPSAVYGWNGLVYRYNTVDAPNHSWLMHIAHSNNYPAPTDAEVYGNIFSGGTTAIRLEEGAALARHDHNVFTQSTPYAGVNGSTAPELDATEVKGKSRTAIFNDPDNGDYSLKAGSPALAAGDPSDHPVYDIGGTRRSATPSVGCYE